jgi:hypothetical protein
MFERIANSWELVKASASVLRSDKELAVFPFISAIGVLVVTATFALPLFYAGFFESMDDPGIAELIVVFAFYLVQYFVIIFANSALVGAALIRLRGGDPTLSDGFSIARKHLSAVLGYSAIAATVGLALQLISERGGILGDIASLLGGIAWSMATFLVVPVLVVEDLGPLDAVKRSAHLLKKTWGEQIAGNFSIGIIFGLLALAVLGAGILAFGIVASSGSFGIVIIALVMLALLGLGLVSSTLSSIFAAAIYNYAVEGRIDEFFPEHLVRNAFRQK